MKLINAFERYYMILSLLICPDHHSSIRSISEHLNVPLQQMRQDFKEILHFPAIQPHILCDDTYFYDCLTEDQKQYMRRDLLAGIYDDVSFSLDGYELGFDLNSILFPILPIEQLALKDQCPEFVQKSSNLMGVYSKKSLSGLSAKQMSYAAKIETAIQSHKGLELRRHTSKGMMSFQIMPKSIFRDTFENTIYCIDSNGYAHPLDTIFSLTVISGFETDSTHLLTDYMWGISYHPDEQVEDVTLIIENATTNLIEKIKADTSRRVYGALKKMPDGTYIYTDKVLGMDAFKRWLRSYGSSVIVQKPKYLALEMYESARKMYEVYETMEFK